MSDERIMGDEVYLGDGLYAKFDGSSIQLRAPRIGGNHLVFMDPHVWAELLRFARETKFGPASFLKGETI